MKRFSIIPAILFAFCVQAQDAPTQYIRHTVEWNETVYSIPVHYNISTKEFLSANGFTADMKLKPGQIVTIRPMTAAEVSAIGRRTKQEKYAAIKAESAKEDVLTSKKEVAENKVVMEKRAPVSYPKATAVTETKTLVPEEKVVIDVQAVVAKIEKARQAFNAVEPKKPAREVSTNEDLGPNGIVYTISENGYHQVERKQTFFHIALIYGLTVEELKRLNNMTTTDITIGQKLKVSTQLAQL